MCKFEQHNQNIIDDDTESVTSVNSYAQLDNIWDGETIELSDDDELDVEPRETPPRKRFKSQYSPVMFCNLVCSNFIYHASKNINLPKNIPKIKNLPLNSLPNVKFLNKPQFLANLSACAPSPSVDTNFQLQKLRNQIPAVLFSKILRPTPPLA